MPKKKRKLPDEDVIDKKIMVKGEKLEESLVKRIKKFFHLHVDNYNTVHGRWIEGTMFVLNFAAIILFVIDTHDPTGIWRKLLTASEISVVGVFILEYMVRIWVAQNKVKHFFSIYSIIDLLSIIPVLLHFANLSFLRIFRILRLFRLIRILRFQRMFKAKDTFFGRLRDTQLIIIKLVLSIFTVVFVFSGILWAIENKINPGEFGTIWHALYFAIVTITTVGYGDITPISLWGRLATSAMIIVGIALIPYYLGKLVKVLLQSSKKTQLVCKKCSLAEHETDARYCRNCGAKLKIPRKKVLPEEKV